MRSLGGEWSGGGEAAAEAAGDNLYMLVFGGGPPARGRTARSEISYVVDRTMVSQEKTVDPCARPVGRGPGRVGVAAGGRR